MWWGLMIYVFAGIVLAEAGMSSEQRRAHDERDGVVVLAYLLNITLWGPVMLFHFLRWLTNPR